MILSRSSTRISPKGHSWKRTALPTTPSISISHPVSTFRWSMKKSAQKWNPVSKIRASIRSKSEINSCFMDTFLSIQSVSVTRQEQHIVSGIGLNPQTPSRRLLYVMHIGWLNKSSSETIRPGMLLFSLFCSLSPKQSLDRWWTLAKKGLFGISYTESGSSVEIWDPFKSFVGSCLCFALAFE